MPIHPLFLAKTHREEPYLTIGKVASITGASPKAIRHYEALGLIPAPHRRGKYRIYSERDVFLVHMLKHSQQFGFRLAEMKELVASRVATKRFPLTVANRLFDRKRSEIERDIEVLRERLRELAAIRTEMNRHFR